MFDEPQKSVSRVLSVSDLTAYIKGLFDGDPVLAGVAVEGEVSNCSQAASGHWYWTLKDEDAALGCVMWRSVAAKQAHLPEEGGAYVVRGSVSVYAVSGRYQLYVDHLEPVGIGDLYRQYEALKAKLEAEGLFEPARKRQLPAFPSRVGVVTSSEAAALRDVVRVLARRWPAMELLLAPASVQGEAAPGEIVAALQSIAHSGAEVVIVTRGGGSIEDLWAFNDETVARAVAACPVPVIAGVGHETDFTIADFVADVRAATPSVAAEIVAPDRRELAQAVDEMRQRLSRDMVRSLDSERAMVERLRHRLSLAAPSRRVSDRRAALEALSQRLPRATHSRLRLAGTDLQGLKSRLGALSPQATLVRGYAIVRRRADGETVTTTESVGPGTGIDVRVADGTFGAVVEGQSRLFAEEGKS